MTSLEQRLQDSQEQGIPQRPAATSRSFVVGQNLESARRAQERAPRTYEIHIYGRALGPRAMMDAVQTSVMPVELVRELQDVLRESLQGAGQGVADLQSAAQQVITHLNSRARGWRRASEGARATMRAAIGTNVPISSAGADYFINLNLEPLPFEGTQIDNWVRHVLPVPRDQPFAGNLGAAFHLQPGGEGWLRV